MNLENAETFQNQVQNHQQDRKETRDFYNKVMEEFNDKCELIEKVKAKVNQEKHQELRKSWNQRSKLDQLQIAFEKEKVKLSRQDCLSETKSVKVEDSKLIIREALIERILQK